jgi:hypothetical protein
VHRGERDEAASEHGRVTARLVAAERDACREQRHRDQRQRRDVWQPVPGEHVECHRRDGVEAGGDEAGRGAPERRSEDEDGEDREHGEHPDAVEERRCRDVRERQERAVDGRDARVEREPVAAQHPVGVVDQERLLALDLLGVEQVLAPVLAGKRGAADHERL